MVIKITDYCTMGCPHCMQNSTPGGKHMSFDVFKDAIAFAGECLTNGNAILISGGEPLEHPEFFKFLDYTLKELPGKLIYVLTNGLLLNDDVACEELRKRFESYIGMYVQICSVRGLYPKHDECFAGYTVFRNSVINKAHLYRVQHISSLVNGITPIGRAKTSGSEIVLNQIATNRISASCFNSYSCLANIGDGNIVSAIKYMKFHSKTSVCKPLILENGDIVFGEYAECSVISNVSTLPPDRIFDINLIEGPCKKCVNTNEQAATIKKHLSVFKGGR